MPRLRPRAVALLALAGLASAGCARRATDDIVLVTIDTLRADHLGAYGYAAARSPTFDALAAGGIRFEAAFAPMPRTTPALATLLSGRLPAAHGSREVGQPMSTAVPVLPELLAARGYQTVGLSANWAAGPEQNLDRGFARFVTAKKLERGGSRSARNVTDRALAAVGAVSTEQPLFLWVHYIDPHFPYRPSREYLPRERRAACDEAVRQARPPRRRGQLYVDVDGRASAALASCVESYDGEIAYVDAELGRLLAGLRVARPGREPLIVVTADHGENLGEDGLFYQHGPSLHDAGVRVPLVIHGPGLEPRVDRSVTRLEDLAPTLLARVGVAADELPPFDGVDLLGAGARGRAEAVAERAAFLESGGALQIQAARYISGGRATGWYCTHGPRFSLCEGKGGPGGLFELAVDPDLVRDLTAALPDEVRRLREGSARWPPETPRARGVRTVRFKLLETPLFDGGYGRALFDLAVDSAERRDVARDERREAARLGALLDDWTRELAAPSPLDLAGEEAEEQLRALGYLN